jgi:hypothetical protein
MALEKNLATLNRALRGTSRDFTLTSDADTATLARNRFALGLVSGAELYR